MAPGAPDQATELLGLGGEDLMPRGLTSTLFFGMIRRPLIEEQLTHSVIGAFFEVYNTLGFGFLEHLYVLALELELRDRGHQVAREVGILVTYKGVELGYQRIDMVVDNKLLVETKSTPELHRSAGRQVFNYLRATNLEVGLLLHFGPKPKFYRTIFNHSPPRTDTRTRDPIRVLARSGAPGDSDVSVQPLV